MVTPTNKFGFPKWKTINGKKYYYAGNFSIHSFTAIFNRESSLIGKGHMVRSFKINGRTVIYGYLSSHAKKMELKKKEYYKKKKAGYYDRTHSQKFRLTIDYKNSKKYSYHKTKQEMIEKIYATENRLKKNFYMYQFKRGGWVKI
jgi:hypothetical protein